jgi:hypothetical protein
VPQHQPTHHCLRAGQAANKNELKHNVQQILPQQGTSDGSRQAAEQASAAQKDVAYTLVHTAADTTITGYHHGVHIIESTKPQTKTSRRAIDAPVHMQPLCVTVTKNDKLPTLAQQLLRICSRQA